MVLHHFSKEVYFKRKEFAPNRSKFFPFRVDPFLEGGLISRKAKRKLQKLSPLAEMAENLPVATSTLKVIGYTSKGSGCLPFGRETTPGENDLLS